jgi:hypothetical protein
MVASSWSCHGGMDKSVSDWLITMLIVKSGRTYVIWWPTSKCKSEGTSAWLDTPRNMCQIGWHHVQVENIFWNTWKPKEELQKYLAERKRLENSCSDVYLEYTCDECNSLMVTQCNSWVLDWLIWSVIQCNSI